MPLRVSWSLDRGDYKSRSRMHQQGHYTKVKRPTGPELYEDAARILDELLQKQLNEQRKSHGRLPRYKTHPFTSRRPVTTGEVLDERDEVGMEDGIERSETMPSRMRDKDEPLRPKDVKALRKKTGDDDDDAASSADTEGDSSSVSNNRKKKGFLRKARDRLVHSFHRQEREKEKRMKDKEESPKVSPKKQARKTPRNKGAKGQQNGLGKEGVPSSQPEESGKRRNSVGKALSSLRKSFRSQKDCRQAVVCADETGSDKRPSAASSSGASRPSPDQDPRTTSPAPPPPSLSALERGGGGGVDGRASAHPHASPPPAPHSGGGSSLTVPAGSVEGRKGSAHSALEHSASPYPHSSSTDSRLGNGASGSLHSFSSSRHNALDNPNEDIKFIDDENDDHYGGDRGRRGWQESGGHGGRQPLRQQSSLCVDGESDEEDGKPDGKPSLANISEDMPLHERTSEEKEEMYGKIAQKLIHIADNYAAESGVSDAEGPHQEAAGACAMPELGPQGDSVLSDLEKQILACLRDAGDRNSSEIDGQAEKFIEQTKAHTYERFKSTMQQSLGNDLSWNHLAVLFYTTKGVVSAVGVGTKLANDAKEMTLQYFSDCFAKWLMDKGGFDSMLSESDSELD